MLSYYFADRLDDVIVELRLLIGEGALGLENENFKITIPLYASNNQSDDNKDTLKITPNGSVSTSKRSSFREATPLEPFHRNLTAPKSSDNVNHIDSLLTNFNELSEIDGDSITTMLHSSQLRPQLSPLGSRPTSSAFDENWRASSLYSKTCITSTNNQPYSVVSTDRAVPELTSYSCVECLERITGTFVSLGEDRVYHPQHLKCKAKKTKINGMNEECGKLVSKLTYKEYDGIIYCKLCYTNTFNDKCGYCNQPIKNVIYVFLLDR